jgi:hypothetical protein
MRIKRYARTASYAQVTERLYDRSRYRYRRIICRSWQPVVPILQPADRAARIHRVMNAFVQGKWHFLYRAVDKHSKTVDFLLRPDRGIAAPQAFKPPMFMALVFAALLAGGGIGRALAAVDPGVTVAPGALLPAQLRRPR